MVTKLSLKPMQWLSSAVATVVEATVATVVVRSSRRHRFEKVMMDLSLSLSLSEGGGLVAAYAMAMV